MFRLRVIDFETDDDAIVEAGYCDLVTTRTDLLGAPYGWEVGERAAFLVDPGRPISPVSSAIHHITDEDVAGKPAWPEVATRIFNAPALAYAAHSAKVEQQLAGDLSGVVPWVCTWKASLRLWPNAPAHSNGALRYWRRPKDLQPLLASPSHRAGPDAYVTAALLRDMLDEAPLGDLIHWTTQPALTRRCMIGDYRAGGKGTPWEDVPSSMLHWILPRDFDEDTKFTVRHHLERREIDQRLEQEAWEMERQYQQNGFNGQQEGFA